MTEAKKPGRWKAGESGNPKGKTPGSGELQRLRASIAADVPDILAGLVSSAKGGDTQAAKLILERVFPAVKPVEQAQAIELPEGGTLTAQGRAVLSAVAGGDLAPGQGAQLLAAIGNLARVTEIDELTNRITALEEKQHAKLG
jgi:hypothetical protein